jgi:hypothetical protein
VRRAAPGLYAAMSGRAPFGWTVRVDGRTHAFVC